MADVGRKAIAQVEGFVARILAARIEPDRAREVARLMATGVWTHDHPLQVPELITMGLPVIVGVPELERALVSLYPQPAAARQRWSTLRPTGADPAAPARAAARPS